jgi:hypothetical protein
MRICSRGFALLALRKHKEVQNSLGDCHDALLIRHFGATELAELGQSTARPPFLLAEAARHHDYARSR